MLILVKSIFVQSLFQSHNHSKRKRYLQNKSLFENHHVTEVLFIIFFSAKILGDKNHVYIGGADALPKGSMLLLESARQLTNLFWGLTAP